MITFIRRAALRGAFIAELLIAPVTAAFGQSAFEADEAYPVAYQDRMTLVAPAQAEAQRQLGKPVELKISSLLYKHSWVFLLSTIVDAKGDPLDLEGTTLEEAAREGGASHVFCALLKWEAGTWTIVASCLGVTDLAWAGWAEEYHAPPEIFELQHEED